MAKESQNNLWRAQDDKGTHLYTGIPNGLLGEIINGKYSHTEVKVLLLIARMSFGFRRDTTNQLSLDDFGMSGPLASRTIKALLNNNTIFRHSKNGNRYVYAINMLRYGLQMKHYRIGKVDDKIDNGVYHGGSIDYELGNYQNIKNEVILYSSKGYGSKKGSYIKEDIKVDRNMDRSNMGSTSTNVPSSNNKPLSSLPVKLPAHKLLTGDETKTIVGTFINDVKKNHTVDTILKHIRELSKRDLDHNEVIRLPYYLYCRKELGIQHQKGTLEEDAYRQAIILFEKGENK